MEKNRGGNHETLNRADSSLCGGYDHRLQDWTWLQFAADGATDGSWARSRRPWAGRALRI